MQHFSPNCRCLYLSLSLYLSISLSLYLSISLSLYLSISLSVYLSIYLSIPRPELGSSRAPGRLSNGRCPGLLQLIQAPTCPELFCFGIDHFQLLYFDFFQSRYLYDIVLYALVWYGMVPCIASLCCYMILLHAISL